MTVKSKEKGAFCSKCGAYSNNTHSKYIRKVLDMPIINKKTILFIISRRFYCKNLECVQVAFSEQFHDIAGKYNRKTGRLTNYLVKFVLSQSANSLTSLFKELIPISSSTFLRIAHNHEIEPNYTSTTIGLDDFSFKRGITFGTLVCDLATNKPIDLIEIRELDPVSNPLKNYTNASLVSRDRSTTYASAINNSLPDAIHVADSFHIIHNLMEASSDFLKTYIGKGVKFDIVNTNKIQFNDEIVVSNSKLNKAHIIDKVKELHKNEMAIRQICREVDLSRNTVRKYINLDDLEDTYSIAHVKKYIYIIMR
ncbi:transposase [Clostridium gasigenes]|nr:transposase [Clostridium gasigenes]